MISIEIPDLKDVLDRLPTVDKTKTVLMRAINRSVPAAKTAASKEVRKEYVLKAAKINEATKITKATTSTLTAKIRWSGPMVNIANYKITPRQRPKRRTKRQMTVEIKRGQKSTYKGAFIGPNARVFRRTTKKRLPIKPIYGPAISHLMGAKPVTEAATKRAQEILDKRIEHEIKRMLK